jgi:hypothetical protein
MPAYLLSFFLGDTGTNIGLLLCDEGQLWLLLEHLEKVTIAATREDTFDTLHEVVVLLCFIFLDTSVTHGCDAFNGLGIEIALQRVLDEAFNHGLHLCDALGDTVDFAVANHFLEVGDGID